MEPVKPPPTVCNVALSRAMKDVRRTVKGKVPPRVLSEIMRAYWRCRRGK